MTPACQETNSWRASAVIAGFSGGSGVGEGLGAGRAATSVMSSAALIMNKRNNLGPRECLAAFEHVEFNQKCKCVDMRAEPLEQTARRCGRSPRRQQIVDDDDVFAVAKCVSVDLERIRS